MTELRTMPSSLNDACRTIDLLAKALTEIIEANKDFRDGMPEDWDGDPLQDACDAAAKLMAVHPSSPLSSAEQKTP